MIRRVALAIVVCVVVLSSFMLLHRAGEQRMKPYYRFVDRSWHRDAQQAAGDANGSGFRVFDPPTATIKDETRYVLFSPARAAVLVQGHVLVPEDGRLSWSVPLPEALQGAERLILAPSIGHAGRWTQLAGVVVRPEIVESKSVVPVSSVLPAELRGSTVDVYVDGLAMPNASTWSWRTPEVDIPSGAHIEFGIGILEPAWLQGPVTFDLQACTPQGCQPLFSEQVDPGTVTGRDWQDRSVSLEAFANTRCTLVFETHLSGNAPDSSSLPVWANPTVYARVARAHQDVNVILLSIDTLRADHLTSYGCQHDTAPFIEQTFAQGGTAFEHCVAAASSTPPSHMTMFTSLQPSVHGVKTGYEVSAPWAVTLAEALRAGGVETGAVTEDAWLGIGQGFGRGFNSYLGIKGHTNFPEGQVELTFAKAKQWLAEHREQRFFLFLHTYQVHWPYTPPRAYDSLFTEHDGQRVTGASPLNLRELIAYDREIRYTDDQLRSLSESIQADGLAGNTVFILTSDHGEGFLEHGFRRHGAHLYEEVTRVPLMFWGPGHIQEGRRIRTTVGHADLMPTILDLAGVPKPAHLTGTSFAPLLQGEPEPARQTRPHFTESWGRTAGGPDGKPVPFEPPAYAIQVGLQKLIRYRHGNSFTYEYYDLASDPGEHTSLFDADDPTVAQLRQQLDTYEGMVTATATSLALQSTAAPAHTPQPVQLDPAQQEELRALGYTN